MRKKLKLTKKPNKNNVRTQTETRAPSTVFFELFTNTHTLKRARVRFTYTWRTEILCDSRPVQLITEVDERPTSAARQLEYGSGGRGRYSYTHTHTHTRIHTYTHTGIHIDTHTHARVQKRIGTRETAAASHGHSAQPPWTA